MFFDDYKSKTNATTFRPYKTETVIHKDKPFNHLYSSQQQDNNNIKAIDNTLNNINCC